MLQINKPILENNHIFYLNMVNLMKKQFKVRNTILNSII